MHRCCCRHLVVAAIVIVAQLASLGSVIAGQSTLRLVSRQDNGRRLPAENIIVIGEETSQLKFQLESRVDPDNQSFPETVVFIIDQDGDKREFKSDDSGQVVIDDVTEGLYAVSAFNKHAHASTIFAIRNRADAPELDQNEDAFERGDDEPPVARLTMAIAVGETLTTIVGDRLIKDADVPADAIDANVVDNLIGLEPFDYKVELGKGGVLRGRLITVMRPSSQYSAVKNTRITITRNGIPVATTTCNALGQFQVGGMKPGVHGLIAAGRGGYAAFSFKAVEAVSLATKPYHLASARLQYDGTILPVALVPPLMIPALQETITDHFPDISSTPPPLIRRAPNRDDRELPAPKLEIAIDDVSIVNIPDGLEPGLIGGGRINNNPLRSRSTGGSFAASDSSSGSTGVETLISVGAAIALPLAASNESRAGVVTSPSGL